MTIERRVGRSAGYGGYNLQHPTIGLPVGCQAGDVLVLYLGLKHQDGGTPAAESVPVPNGWHRLGSSLDRGGYASLITDGGNSSLYVFYKEVAEGEIVPSSININIGSVSDIVVDICVGYCDGFYSTTGDPIKVTFAAGGGDCRLTQPIVAMDAGSDCYVRPGDYLTSFFVQPTDGPVFNSYYDDAYIICPGLGSALSGFIPFTATGNTNIGGFAGVGRASGSASAVCRVEPYISVDMLNGDTHARGAACIVRISDNTSLLEDQDTFTADGNVPKSIGWQTPARGALQDYSTAYISMPPVENPDLTALFAFIGSGRTTDAELPDINDWTKLGSAFGGTGAYGNGTGPRRATVYRRDVVPFLEVNTNTEVYTFGTNAILTTCLKAIIPAFQILDVNIGFGIDSTSGTAWSALCNQEITPKEGDLIYIQVVCEDTSTTYASPVLTLAGTTFSAPIICCNASSAWYGGSLGTIIYGFPVLAAGDPGYPTFTCTTNYAVSGVTTFLHLSSHDAPVSQGILDAFEAGDDTMSCEGLVNWATHGSMSATEDSTEDVASGRGWLFNKGAFSYGAAGTGANGSTSCAPSYPSGITTNDLLFCFVCSGQSSQNTPTMPAGWTRLCTLSGGDNATFGIDLGNRRVTVFRKDVTLGTESGTVSVALSSGNTMRAHIVRFRSSSGLSGVQITTATASSSLYAAEISAITNPASGIHFNKNSLYAILVAHSKDSAAPNTGSESIQLSCDQAGEEGPTFEYLDNITSRISTAVTTGNDHRFVLYTADTSFWGEWLTDYFEEFDDDIAFNMYYTTSATTCGAAAFVAMSVSAPGVMNAAEDGRDSADGLGYIGNVNPYIDVLRGVETPDIFSCPGGSITDRPSAYFLQDSTYGFSTGTYNLNTPVAQQPTEAGDFLLIFVGTHDRTVANIPAISGWTRLATAISTEGVHGWRTGPRRATVFSKIATGDHSSEYVTITGLTAETYTSTIASCCVIKKSELTGYDFNIQVVTAIDSVLDTDWSMGYAPALSIPTPSISCIATFEAWANTNIVPESPALFELSNHQSSHVVEFYGSRLTGYYVAGTLKILRVTYPKGSGLFPNLVSSNLVHDVEDLGGQLRTGAGVAVLVSLIPTGGFGILGNLSATEITDILSATGVVTSGSSAITGTLSVTESGVDSISSSGDVIVSGTLSVSDAGVDSFASSGTVAFSAIVGSLAATEQSIDTGSFTGKVVVKGSLSPTEPSTDTLSISGDVFVRGSLAVAEQGVDAISSTGRVVVKGSLVSAESASPDTFSGSGDIFIKGALLVSEVGSDSLISGGRALIQGDLYVQESPGESLVASGDVLIRGTGAFVEIGADQLTSIGGIAATGSLSVFENSDAISGAGKVFVRGSLSASDLPDSFSGTGGAVSVGSLSATENQDSFQSSGSVYFIPVVGSLVSVEAGSDTATVAGKVLVDGALLSSEDPDLAAMLGAIPVSGNLVLGEEEDLFEATGSAFSPAPEEAIILADLAQFTIQAGITESVIIADLQESVLAANVENTIIVSDIEETTISVNITRITLEASL